MECRKCGNYCTDGLRYCHRCGSRTAMLQSAGSLSKVFLTGGDRMEVECVLENIGVSEARVKSCTFDCSRLGIPNRTASPHAVVSIEPESKSRFVADLGACGEKESSFNLTFHFVSDDGERGEFPDWNTECERRFDVDVRVEITKPGDVCLYPNAIFLSGQVTSAEVLVVNRGGRDAQVTRITAPERLRITDERGAPIVLPWTITRRSSTRLLFETSDVPSMRNQAVSFAILGGTRKTLPILVPKIIKASFRPSYVVGIDFGTANTSIAVRDLLTGKVSLVKNEQDRTRFSSSMYVQFPQHGGKKFFGEEADNYATVKGALDQGILAKGLKTSLREDNDSFAEKYGHEYGKKVLARMYFEHLKDLINHHFEQVMGKIPEKQTEVLYYITLPVLDKSGDRYNRQLSETMCAVEGDPSNPNDSGPFPRGKVEYRSEPESAALYCFSQLRRRDEFQGLHNTLCVFDSGGGTTDVCLMRIGYGGGGEPEFTLLGTGCAEVGGNEVTECIVKSLNRRNTPGWNEIKSTGPIISHIDWYVDLMKTGLTSRLIQARNSGEIETIGDCQGISVDLGDYISGHGEGEMFSKADEDEVVKQLLPALRGCVQEAHDDALQSVGSPYYVLAVGGNSLVPHIREDIFDRYHGNTRPHVLPRITVSDGGFPDKLDRVLIGDAEEVKSVSEAVANGSVLWYGASLVKRMPFGIVFRMDGYEKVITEPDSLFAAPEWDLEVDPSMPAECELLITSSGLPEVLSGMCCIGTLTLPAKSDGKYRLDATLQKNVLIVDYTTADGHRQHAVRVNIEAAMDVLG